MNKVGIAAVLAYAATVPLANWFVGNVGVTFGQGPHLIQVFPGIYAPSGVLWIGAALALRNVVQERLGRVWSMAGILCGAFLSWWVASPALASASAGAFAASELADMAIWSGMRVRGILPAQLLSNVASDVIDSILFLWLAFGSLGLLAGQVIGKEEVTAITVVALVLIRAGRYATVLQ